MTNKQLNGYFSVVVPFSKRPTEWHPSSPVGPFSTLTRGAFASEYLAHQWAFLHLEGQEYSVRFYSLA
jgi:hypothetical protein